MIRMETQKTLGKKNRNKKKNCMWMNLICTFAFYNRFRNIYKTDTRSSCGNGDRKILLCGEEAIVLENQCLKSCLFTKPGN